MVLQFLCQFGPETSPGSLDCRTTHSESCYRTEIHLKKNTHSRRSGARPPPGGERRRHRASGYIRRESPVILLDSAYVRAGASRDAAPPGRRPRPTGWGPSQEMLQVRRRDRDSAELTRISKTLRLSEKHTKHYVLEKYSLNH